MARKFWSVLAAGVALSLLGGPWTASAAPYYEGKVITIIVGYGAGGGYDRVARLLAKHLPKHIPGNPSVIVENMPGADSMIAANHLYNKAAPDGLTIGTFNRGLGFAQLFKSQAARFDLTKYSWIGSAASEGTVLLIRTDLPSKTIQDLMKSKETLILGNTGPADSSGAFATLVSEALGIKLKNITYPSGSDVMLAIERKEVDGRGGTFSSNWPFIDRGLVRAVVRGRVMDEGMENIPLDEDLTADPKWKKVLAARSVPDKIGRPFVAPPKTPDEIMGILRDAFAKASKDPELIAEAKKTNLSIEYTPAAETLKILDELLNQPPEVANELSRFFKF